MTRSGEKLYRDDRPPVPRWRVIAMYVLVIAGLVLGGAEWFAG